MQVTMNITLGFIFLIKAGYGWLKPFHSTFFTSENQIFRAVLASACFSQKFLNVALKIILIVLAKVFKRFQFGNIWVKYNKNSLKQISQLGMSNGLYSILEKVSETQARITM
jgi:hypothetical protein